MARFNYDKINQQRRDRRKSVRIDTFNQTRGKDLPALWNTAIMNSEVFLSGKYIHKNIDTIVKTNPNYCIWVIDNQPQGIVARQLLRHFNKKHE
jgi:hypothetical protein